ncbi:MAG: integrase [Methyloprofundus sp.]|nr:integrase [Methyloprofundus sp.]
MDNTFPQIEILPNQTPFNGPEIPRKPWYTVRRLFVFTLIFVLSAGFSLAYVYSRPALFKSYATLLTVAQTAIDQQSGDADVQHVAIQRQILTGQELLDETLTGLNQNQQSGNTLLSAAELRGMLTVEAVPETNLVELAAIGYQADALAPIINVWIDVYLKRRAEEIRQTTGLTIEVIQEELSGLETKILIKRTELEEFRLANDIISLGRENIFENQKLAKFRGLNQSLSAANEETIKTKAELDTIKRTIAEGRVVASRKEKRGMRTLELRLQKLRKQLADLDSKYTRDYLALQPKLNSLPQEIAELEEKIRIKNDIAKNIALSDAEYKYEIAREALSEIQRQLEGHKLVAAEFSAKFSEHESLLGDMEGLELLQREAQERLAQIEARQAEKFPQVKVIELPFSPQEPISPNYTRDAVIAVVGSIFLALFSVWVVEFLTRKEVQTTTISVTGSNLYRDMAPDLISSYQQRNEQLKQQTSQSLQQEHSHKLAHESLREVKVNELEDLLEMADIRAKQLITLLLSGLKLDEIAGLTGDDFDFNNDSINIKGENQRSILLNSAIKTLFEHIEPCPVWNKGRAISVEKLESILVYTAVDADLAETSTDAIAYSYILYLVKQGIRFSDLEHIIGYIDPDTLSEYSRFSPQKRGLPVAEINLLHPALEKYID